MSPSTATAKAPQALKLTAALAATSGALHQTLLAVVRAQGVNGAAWLDQLEAQFVRNAKNMTFTGCAMDAEAGAVEAALVELEDDHDGGSGAEVRRTRTSRVTGIPRRLHRPLTPIPLALSSASCAARPSSGESARGPEWAPLGP